LALGLEQNFVLGFESERSHVGHYHSLFFGFSGYKKTQNKTKISQIPQNTPKPGGSIQYPPLEILETPHWTTKPPRATQLGHVCPKPTVPMILINLEYEKLTAWDPWLLDEIRSELYRPRRGPAATGSDDLMPAAKEDYVLAQSEKEAIPVNYCHSDRVIAPV